MSTVRAHPREGTRGVRQHARYSREVSRIMPDSSSGWYRVIGYGLHGQEANEIFETRAEAKTAQARFLNGGNLREREAYSHFEGPRDNETPRTLRRV